MPEISGLEALTYFRQHLPTVPVVVITGWMEHEIARQARAVGAFAIVGKPVDLHTLKGLVALAEAGAGPMTSLVVLVLLLTGCSALAAANNVHRGATFHFTLPTNPEKQP